MALFDNNNIGKHICYTELSCIRL